MTITPFPPRPSSPDPNSSSTGQGPSPRAGEGPLSRRDAEALGLRIQAQAAAIAEATCELLLMVAEFDAREGFGCYVGVKSTAHWLAWSCSMSQGTAREHVRVARALPSLPLTLEHFRAGRLSYSKVREITRVADRVDEEALVEMARSMTASQLARTISSFRAVDGSRLGQDAVREARWQVREDGMIEIRAVLPAEMGAELVTALELAMDRDGHDPATVEDGVPARSASTGSTSSGSARTTAEEELDEAEQAARTAAEVSTTSTLEQRKADALVSVARTYLETEPDDRSGEDRHLVIVQVSADALPQDAPAGARDSEPPAKVPAGTPDADRPAGASEKSLALASPADVPAGTVPQCGALGLGPLEPRTAERLACTGRVSLMVTDAGGEVLHLGRSQRLASRAQRRALRLRDATCTFPGCHQWQHLDAHHTIPWSQGGPTDIEGLALLCRRHHVMVHEGGLRLVPDRSRATRFQPRFQVLDPSGRSVTARWPAMIEHLSLRDAHQTSAQVSAQPPAQTSPQSTVADASGTEESGTTPSTRPGADPERIAASTGGAGFRLADCVDVLCRSILQPAA